MSKLGHIAILGGTGTLGHQLVELLLESSDMCSSVLIYSRDELKQLQMMNQYASVKLTFKLGDIRDKDRLTEILEGIDTVVHAAALKHVVMAELNPEECRKTNVLGTNNVMEACRRCGVGKVVMVSTDKAINPIGIYGKSKQEAERLILNNPDPKLSSSVVRLGNIFGSRGSVVEQFYLMKKKGVLEITDLEATRFCISSRDAAQFIINHLNSDGTSIAVPKMKAFSILDLANVIAPECEKKIIGLRAGDKLHEEIDGMSSDSQVLCTKDELIHLLNNLN